MKGMLSFFLTLLVSGQTLCQQPGLDTPVAIEPFLNGALPHSAPGTATGWTTENAFPNLTFVDPLWLTPVPGSDDFLLVGKDGQLWRFPNDPATPQSEVVQVLDWRTNTQTSEDQGFYCLVFHPEFSQPDSPNTDYAYVCYNHRPSLPGADANHTFWRVSRFTWLRETGTLDPTSEFVLMNQYDRCRWHNGGAMFFDNDGFLNITCGDGGDSSEGGGLTGPDGALSRTQRLDGGLFSGVFRIDVDNDPAKSHPIRRQPTSPANKPAGWPESFTQGYGIPNDNPWQDPSGSILEEYHSLGLRSPHTAHYDALTGEIWVGDVGEAAREEMTRLVMGDNGQWGYREGFTNGPGNPAIPPIGTERLPELDYTRDVGTCIIGGMRYRGAKWHELLGGKLLYGDHSRGRIWTATLDPAGGPPEIELIIEGFPTGSKAGLGNFCTDDAGEVYLMTLTGTNQGGGTIRKLGVAGISTEPPQFLSQTGVFSDLATLDPAPGVVPYTVANPLWSDGAAKRRWIALPNDGSHNSPAETIVFSENDNWSFPPGTVFVKHFEINTSENDPSAIKRLETRLLVCTDGGGKYGITYKWNAEGTDAELLTSGLQENYQVALADGGSVTRRWDYPSRADCLQCHTPAAGQALGIRTAPLNMLHFYPSTGRTANQLATFNSLGMFNRTLSLEELEDFIEARPLDDPTAPLEHRMRSYLDSNCSHCHQPEATVDFFDARLGTALVQQGLVNGVIRGHFALEDGFYLKPGEPDLSALHVRLANVGNGAAMPPLAKNVVDQDAVELLETYLLGLNPGEFETTPSPETRYVRLTATSEVNGNPWTTVGELSILDETGLPIPTTELSIFDYDSEELDAETSPATNAIDGDPDSFWHSQWSDSSPPHPHFITIDLGSLRPIGGFAYTPRQGNQNGRIANYEVHHSEDAVTWTPMTSGTWGNDSEVKTYRGLIGVRKARCEIAGPQETVGGNFDVTVVFDTDVTDFTIDDVQVGGGIATKVRGSGYYYVATISPTQSTVTVEVPADVANLSGLGNRASNPLAIDFTDTLGPLATFTGLPASGTVAGPFILGIEFSEPPIGFSSASLSATNAILSGLSGVGTSFQVAVEPLMEGSFSIMLSAHGISDDLGNLMLEPVSAVLTHAAEILYVEAEEGVLSGDMAVVADTGSSNGAYLWLPDGGYPDNWQNFDPEHSATYTFVLPRGGNWILEGLLRSDDNSSDSFWAEIDGGTIHTWDTNAGQVGSGMFTWDPLSSREPALDPVTLELAAGSHSVVLYGRDDGTRLDALRFTSERPLVTLSAPPAVVGGGGIPVGVSFSRPVTGLTTGDFELTGAAVASLSGSGQAYTLVVSPSSPLVTASLPDDAAIDVSGHGNHYSNPISIVVRSHFEQWAIDRGLDGLAPEEDPNHDGLPALVEFLLNLDPTSAGAPVFDPANGASGLPRMNMEDGRLAIEFPRSTVAHGAGYRYIAQFSDDLKVWEDAEDGTPVPLADGWEHMTIQDPVSTPPAGRRFVRLKLIEP